MSSRSYINTGAERSGLDEARVDVRRYLAALRRSRLLIVAIIAIITGIVLALSMVMPDKYRATATVVVDFESGVLSTPDSTTVERSLATMNALLLSDDVLEAAAEAVPGESPSTISSATATTVDPTANLIDIGSVGETQRRPRRWRTPSRHPSSTFRQPASSVATSSRSR